MTEESITIVLLEFLAQTRPTEFIDVPNGWKSRSVSDLGFDSLDLTTLSLDIEESIGVRIEPEEIGALDTLGDLIRLCQTK